eukprot:TRINITY_DN7968_c0_g1_i1.p1 TRINITY_DN7968_c0_g1~~TRINITY_DN7968_c0_g1_i1.p1  ORF type:complete len:903 (-),score=292.98 TRINITY_DN7968_c0_g1_i1:117-2792(-)
MAEQQKKKDAAAADKKRAEQQKPGEKGKKKEEEVEMSPEDLALKEEIDLCVVRTKDMDAGVQKMALDTLRKEIREATASMTSAPKPLKFLRPHYVELCDFFKASPAGDNKRLLADVLSVLALTMGDASKHECLSFKLQGDVADLESWGHDFVRNLAGEIGEQYNKRVAEEQDVADLMVLVEQIVPFHMQHSAEPDACDLLMEIGQLEKILQYVDVNNPSRYERVCLYLVACASYVPEPEDRTLYHTAATIYRRAGRPALALQLFVKLGDIESIKTIFADCGADGAMRKQLAFILARHGTYATLNAEELAAAGDTDEAEALSAIVSNAKLAEYFGSLATELSISAPKDPDDVFKSAENPRSSLSTTVDSARMNLATTFANAFINVASGKDLIVTKEGSKWLYKNKDHGMMSAAASIGMILMWDIDEGLSQIDKYLYVQDSYIKAGALLGIGIVNCTVRNECDPAFALLQESVESTDSNIRTGALLGLGLAYAGMAREDVMELIIPVVESTSANPEVVGIAALALGMVFVSTANTRLSEVLIGVLLEASKELLNSTYSRFICVGLGLLFLGKGDSAEVALEAAKVLQGSLAEYTLLTIRTCAYAGTCNVLEVQKLLQVCGEHAEEGKEVPPGPNAQGVAVLGIALIAMGEDLGSQMAARSLEHLLQYGDPAVRRAVPLALGLLSVSNPQMSVMDTLSKLSHDSDSEVGLAAIFALGLIGAGTLNSREAGMLQQLAGYYLKDPSIMFMVRLSQGLLHMGKGTMTINPFHSDRLLMSPVAMAGLLAVVHSCLDIKNIILGKSHYLLYTIAVAMYPRTLMTFDENLQQVKTSVRVGQAVDIAGQAGRPKAITGFQTHTTPVLFSHGDRAELASDDYVPLNPTLEGFVILKKSPTAE